MITSRLQRNTLYLSDPPKGGCYSQGVLQSLLHHLSTSFKGFQNRWRLCSVIWINLLKRSSILVSRSTMSNYNTCTCSSVAWNAFGDKRPPAWTIWPCLVWLKTVTSLESSLSTPLQ